MTHIFIISHILILGICDIGYGGAECTQCANGTFKSTKGSDECIDCGTGETTENAGATSTAQCKYFVI